MSYSAYTKLYCKFADSYLLEETTGLSLTVHGPSPVIVDGVYDSALQLNTDTYLSTNQSLSITGAMTISFWLKPKCPGLVLNTLNQLVPLKMSLLSKATFTYSAGNTTASDGMFFVWEETQTDNANVLKVRLRSSSQTVIVSSPPYSADQWHHFWVVYSGGSNIASIYVDGATASTVSGTIPSSLWPSSSPLEINHTIDGSAYNVARNSGVLDDLLIMNSAIVDISKIARAANLGAGYVSDNILSNTRIAFTGGAVNDPTTVQVTGVASNNSEAFIGRTDGTLLRGRREIWEHQRFFGEESEFVQLEAQYGGGIAVTDGLLLPTVMIRS